MDELYQMIDNLKNSLDNESCINDLVISISKIKDNEELVDKIKKCNTNYSEELKKEIFSYEEIVSYKHLETEANFLILEIRKELKKIVEKGGCAHCE